VHGRDDDDELRRTLAGSKESNNVVNQTIPLRVSIIILVLHIRDARSDCQIGPLQIHREDL
jgi:hypothetical protein